MNDDEELIGRAKARVDAELDALDPVVQRRLDAARRAALDQFERPQHGARPGWVPLAAAATVALVAIGVGIGTRAPPPAAPLEAASELEVMLGDDDPALYDEELEFYAWLDEQPDAG